MRDAPQKEPLTMVAFVLAVIAGIGIDLGLYRLMVFGRTAWSPWVSALIFYVVFLGVPCGQYPLVEHLASSTSALGAGVVLFVAGPVMVLRLRRDGLSSWDRLQRRKETMARNRSWYALESRQRSEVRRLARKGRLHPDPVVDAIVKEWATETVDSNYGQYLRLAKRITVVEATTTR